MGNWTIEKNFVIGTTNVGSETITVTTLGGKPGIDGIDGTDGVGVVSGGTTGQVLAKKSNTDYDTEWVDQSGGTTLTESDIYEMRVNFNGGDLENKTVVQSFYDTQTSESLSIVPSGFKESKVFSPFPLNGNGDGTFTRASTATRVNENGDVELVQANVPRIDFSRGEGVLLLEPSATNLYLNSALLATQNVTTTAQSYTVQFRGTGTITFTGSYTGSLVGTGENELVSLTFTATAGTLTSTITGTVKNGQIESGDYASSYIPTTSTTVTRIVDAAKGFGDLSNINSEEGVLYCDVNVASSNFPLGKICLTEGNNTNNLQISFNGTAMTFVYVNNGVPSINKLIDYPAYINKFIKIAYSYANNNFRVFIDGVKIYEQLSGSTSSGKFTQLVFLAQNLSNNNYFCGKAKSVKVFKTALSDAQMIELTTNGYLT